MLMCVCVCVVLFFFLLFFYFSSSYSFLLEFNLHSWWNVNLSVKGSSNRECVCFVYAVFLFVFITRVVSRLAQRSRGKTMMVPCDTEYPAFVSERTIKETTGNIDCEGCVRYERRTTTQRVCVDSYQWRSDVLTVRPLIGAAGPSSFSRFPAATSSWWLWTTSVTAAALHPLPWILSKSCISFPD